MNHSNVTVVGPFLHIHAISGVRFTRKRTLSEVQKQIECRTENVCTYRKTEYTLNNNADEDADRVYSFLYKRDLTRGIKHTHTHSLLCVVQMDTIEFTFRVSHMSEIKITIYLYLFFFIFFLKTTTTKKKQKICVS